MTLEIMTRQVLAGLKLQRIGRPSETPSRPGLFDVRPRPPGVGSYYLPASGLATGSGVRCYISQADPALWL